MLKLGSGKNKRPPYFIKNYLRYLIPDKWYRKQLQQTLAEVEKRPDRDAILDRVAYYNKLSSHTPISAEAPRLGDFRRRKEHSFYYFDARESTRWFPIDRRWHYLFGDVWTLQDKPTIVKSRPICGDNSNSVILKLNKFRHFIHINDKTPFSQKRDQAIFRGGIKVNPIRVELFRIHYGNPLCDLGAIRLSNSFPQEWARPKISLWKHLNYKFIFAIEGYDVASNLKWIMSSQSVAVMPRPTCETWFMEGRLVPEKHYIEIKADFSDLEEKLNYYIAHPDEAVAISKNANEYWEQFLDPKREMLTALMVLDKYFRLTN